MLEDCDLMKEMNLSVSNSFYNCDVNYKVQNIFNFDGEILGGELLLDFSSLATNKEFQLYNDAIDLGLVTNDTIAYIYKKAINNFDFSVFGSVLFINIERSSLCDVRLLSQIKELSMMLYLNSVKLIVEITERNKCGYCSKPTQGVEYLKKHNVALALDDFDYINGDFRTKELTLDLYDYVKVDIPQSFEQLKMLESFVDSYFNHLGKGLIIERVEKVDELFLCLPHESIYGYQGFYFCRGKSLLI